MHEIFAQRGATNVVWVWSPTAWSFVTRSPWPPDYYPGDAYVDWVAADGYNWYPRPRSPWRSFTSLRPFYDWATTKTKPIMIAENGVMEDPAAARSQGGMDHQLPQLMQVDLSHDPGRDVFRHPTTKNGFTYTWQVDTSQSSYNAYRAMGADPYFSPSHGRWWRWCDTARPLRDR